ncbi:TlpA family protein disulfide reductase [Biomphalaria pfeifferi]|uniref:TlpA family protein disulfide reductase n=1 Tax=Biomphalaria pfeifferi TaxID=112525 RepID=A0AAD8AP87_BIOPF|nr:TlpA family protein disulfide reductase [Biomphalaria pfeifferi]
MKDNERLMMQTTEVLAGGERSNLKGKKFLTGFGFDFETKKISPQKGWQGIDSNEDGKVDMNPLSFEAANADDETVVFRVGQMFVSFKKVDMQKNLIRDACTRSQRLQTPRTFDGQRVSRFQFRFPDFNFVDFNGKKRKFSEFRGKYVLLDIWGFLVSAVPPRNAVSARSRPQIQSKKSRTRRTQHRSASG